MYEKIGEEMRQKIASAEKCRKDIVYGNEMYFQKIEN